MALNGLQPFSQMAYSPTLTPLYSSSVFCLLRQGLSIYSWLFWNTYGDQGDLKLIQVRLPLQSWDQKHGPSFASVHQHLFT